MFDATKILGELLDHATSPAASGRLSGALAQSGTPVPGVTPAGTGAPGAIGGGLLAALGSVAFSALQKSGQTPSAAANPTLGPPLGLDTHEDVQSTATLLLRAMINAAKADGQIDQKELERILGKLQEVGSDASARDFVISELGKPLDINGLVSAVKSPHQAVQVYAASLLAIDVDTPAETKYLAQLAQALKLGPDVVTQINGAMAVKV
jgi:uncharacterized membrane protein YebE (DUF533 family)